MQTIKKDYEKLPLRFGFFLFGTAALVLAATIFINIHIHRIVRDEYFDIEIKQNAIYDEGIFAGRNSVLSYLREFHPEIKIPLYELIEREELINQERQDILNSQPLR